MAAQSDALEETLALLEKLAGTYPPGSPEAGMIEFAAKAVIYVNGEAARGHSAQFLHNSTMDLTPEALEDDRRKTAR